MVKKNSEEKTLRALVFQNITWIAVVLLGIINLWLGSKLTPLVQDIAMIKQNVQAIEQRTATIETNQRDFVSSREFNQVVSRLDSISRRLDQVIGILANK